MHRVRARLGLAKRGGKGLGRRFGWVNCRAVYIRVVFVAMVFVWWVFGGLVFSWRM